MDDSFLINNKAIYLLLLRAHCCVAGAIVVPCHYAAERRFAWWLCGRWADVHSIHLEGDNMFIITQSAAAQSVVSTVSHSVITSRASAPQQYKTISTVCILFHCTDYASVDYVDDGRRVRLIRYGKSRVLFLSISWLLRSALDPQINKLTHVSSPRNCQEGSWFAK